MIQLRAEIPLQPLTLIMSRHVTVLAAHRGPIAVVPYRPMNLVAEGSVGMVDLRWEDKSSNETGFQIYRKSGNCSSTNPWGLITTTRTEYHLI